MTESADTNSSEFSGLTKIEVCGFKSLSEPTSIAIRPLTILAGANSSGKSSIMQPLLLMKQTLEASFDPGVFLLNGPNVKFTLADQLLSRNSSPERADRFYVKFEAGSDQSYSAHHYIKRRSKGKDIGFEIDRQDYRYREGQFSLRPGMPSDELKSIFLSQTKFFSGDTSLWELSLKQQRCFLNITFSAGELRFYRYAHDAVTNLIHLPGLRGNPERDYQLTGIGSHFPGTFDVYTASIVAQWEADGNLEVVNQLGRDLGLLGLNWKVTAKRKNDTQVELMVGRLNKGKNGKADMVNIADVGFGVSQTLPILVALLKAVPGQIVYVEQPEIHLHPRAQFAMAQILVNAAKRGVRVIIETHSSLLLLGVQALVAEGKADPDLMALHWFSRRSDGSTEVNSADLDADGAFGDWPEDFADVELEAESRYLDAVDLRRSKG